jgi:hypothetical protein
MVVIQKEEEEEEEENSEPGKTSFNDVSELQTFQVGSK